MERGYMEQARAQDAVNNEAFISQSPEQHMTNADPKMLARERRQRRRELAQAEARNARTGLWTISVMADWAIRQAARTEPDRVVRRERRHILKDTWRRFTGDLMRQTGRL